MALSLNLGNIVVHLRANTLQFQKNIKAAEALMLGASRRMAAAAVRMSLAVTAPITLMSALAIKAFGSFDQAMTESLAIMGDVSAGMRLEMEKTARTMAKEGVTSATDLAESYFFLASAGLDAQASINALGVVQQFSVAGAFNMAVATDLLTDAQTALGISSKDPIKNQTEMLRLSDALVKANTLANASVEQFSRALTTKSATALRTVGKELEEGIAILAAYADAGIKANNAGEQLNILFRELQRGALKQSKNWDKLGVSTFDVAGEMRATSDIIRDLEDRLEGMSDKQVRMTLTLLGFQSRSISAITPLIGMSDKLVIFEDKLKKAGGTTKDVAEKQLKSFISQMKITVNQIKDVGISIGRILMPMILRAGKAVRRATVFWDGLTEGTKKFIVQVGLILALIGPLLFILAKFLALGAFLLGLLGTFAGFISFMTAAIGAVVSFGAAIVAFLITPIGFLIAIFVLLGAVVVQQTKIGAKAVDFLAGNFNNLSNIISRLLDRTKVTFGAIASAIKQGDIAAAVKVLWLQIQMEWARGMSNLADMWGDTIDTAQKAWDGIADGAVSAMSVINTAVFGMARILIRVFTQAKRAIIDLKTIGRSGARRSQLAALVTGAAGQIGDLNLREFEAQEKIRFNQERRDERISNRIPIADRAADQLQAATKAWTEAVGTIAKAEEDNRKKLAGPVFAGAEKGFLERERKRLERLNLQNQGTDEIGLSAGSFFASQLQAFGSAEVQDEKEVQLQQLLTQKQMKTAIEEGNKLLEENAGVITIG